MKSGAQAGLKRPSSRDLTALIEEATAALVRMDAERLRELALSCEVLNRELPRGIAQQQPNRAGAWEAGKAMLVFSRVLEATRANAEFFRRLCDPGSEQLEYRPRCTANWNVNGHH